MFRHLFAILGLLSVTPDAQAAELPVPAGVDATRLTFYDGFNHFLSSSNGLVGWMTKYANEGRSARALPELEGNREAEFYSDISVGHNPFSVENGILSIKAEPAQPFSNPYGMPYVSGAITTYKSFAQTYGYFEVRAKLPHGKGLWSAFWMLPTIKNWTTELDIFEVLGDKPGILYSTIHWRQNEAVNAPIGNMKTSEVDDTSAAFHTYGADWEPDKIRYYMDGKMLAEVDTPKHMNIPMYMLLNLAVGGEGSWPGKPDATTKFPAAFQIDYVKAFATKNTRDVQGTLAITR